MVHVFDLVFCLLHLIVLVPFSRRVFEFEKKANEELVEQNKGMEKNLVSMAREIEKLRAEKFDAERRPRGPGIHSLALSRLCARAFLFSFFFFLS